MRDHFSIIHKAFIQLTTPTYPEPLSSVGKAAQGLTTYPVSRTEIHRLKNYGRACNADLIFFFNDMHWCLRSELLKLKSVCDSLGNLVKTDSDSVDLQWGLRHGISKKLPEDAAGSRTGV